MSFSIIESTRQNFFKGRRGQKKIPSTITAAPEGRRIKSAVARALKECAQGKERRASKLSRKSEKIVGIYFFSDKYYFFLKNT